MNNNRCVCCGEIIPEGRMVCLLCEKKQIKLGLILQSFQATTKEVSNAYSFMEGNDDD